MVSKIPNIDGLWSSSRLILFIICQYTFCIPHYSNALTSPSHSSIIVLISQHPTTTTFCIIQNNPLNIFTVSSFSSNKIFCSSSPFLFIQHSLVEGISDIYIYVDYYHTPVHGQYGELKRYPPMQCCIVALFTFIVSIKEVSLNVSTLSIRHQFSLKLKIL